ncbi:hypothetical protein A7A76_03505 [Lysobacter enzymogenes]|nr:hypothetical protein [Lysobacter enzymogenes]
MSGLPKDYDLKALEPLLERLAAFKPDLIAIKAVSGEGCDHLSRYHELFDGEQAYLDRGDLLGLYRFLNAPQTQQAAIAADFGGNLRERSSERYGRQYVAWWEARNLRMAANLREAFGNRPGIRVLDIVGSSHKPYLDAYLRQMHDLEVLDVQALLAPGTR